jgi:hypothetical protein
MKNLFAIAAMLAAFTAPVFAGSIFITPLEQGSTVTFNELEVGCQDIANRMDTSEAHRMARKFDPKYDCQFMEKNVPLQAEQLAIDDGKGSAWPEKYAVLCVRAKRQVDKYGKTIPQNCFWVLVERTKATTTSPTPAGVIFSAEPTEGEKCRREAREKRLCSPLLAICPVCP